MARKGFVVLLSVLAIAALVGVGYSAFTATATINGTASAGTAILQVTGSPSSYCAYPTGAPAPGQIVSSVNGAKTVVTLSASNLVPGSICTTDVYVQDVGTVPLLVSSQLNETSGICPGAALNCYDVSDSTGLTSVTPVTSVSGFTTLTPMGPSYTDVVSIWIPAGSVTAPPSGVFSIYFTGVAGD